MTSYKRSLPLPSRSFLLLGPRGTGKTTWLREHLPSAAWYNLLLDRELFRLMRDPGAFRLEIEALPRGSWVVIDEAQKLPALLNEVHDAMSSAPNRWKFALSGSSARRFRRADVNLLGGRVIMRRMAPLTMAEMAGKPDINDLLKYGALPLVRNARTALDRIDLLEAYVETYLTQEIRAEALVRSLEGFSRFLEVAALANGQVTNLASLARDSGVARPTVQGYFEVLTDTLLGAWLPAWRPRVKVKEVAHSKFYLFDSGVARALGHRLREPLDSAERGTLLETMIFHELRAHLAYTSTGGDISYFRTPHGTEIDFLWTRGHTVVAIEVKASERWRSEYSRAMNDLHASKAIKLAFGVYLGEREIKDGAVRVLPLSRFLEQLENGKIIP